MHAVIHLIRHGQASFGLKSYDQLSEIGIAQAQALGQYFCAHEVAIAQVYSGSLQRHQQSAQCFLEKFGQNSSELSVQTMDSLNEYKYRELLCRLYPSWGERMGFVRTMRQAEQVKKAFVHEISKAIVRWQTSDEAYTETWLDFSARCTRVLYDIARQAQDGQQIAVFTSGGVIAAMLIHALSLPSHQFLSWHNQIGNGSVSKLIVHQDETGTIKIKLGSFNETGYLPKSFNTHL